MLKVVYGTGNPAKLSAMRRALKGLDLQLTGAGETGLPLPQVQEDGKTPLENARIKARAYYEALKRPVFSCDTALILEGIPPIYRPGVRARRAGGQAMDDGQMIEYYGDLARRFGPVRARYQNAICLNWDRDTLYECQDEDLWGEPFLLLDTPHPRREKGFPLDSLSADLASGAYLYDLGPQALDGIAMGGGFFRFFTQVIRMQG